jgi:uncharacterized membrane protein
MDRLPDLLTAVGRFHPLILHFPIGLIAGVVGLELWMAVTGSRQLRGAAGILLALATVGAVLAALCGLLLASSGEYEGALLDRHRVFGLTTAGLTVAAWLLHRRLSRAESPSTLALYRATLAAGAVALAGAAHFGGIITHGDKSPFAALAIALHGSPVPDVAPVAIAGDAARDETAQRAVRQILETRCFECHSDKKQKSGLRLDSRAAALAGGESGHPAIVPGDAMASQMVKAVTLPRDDKRAMPPSGKRRLEPGEVLVLIDWINRGAAWPDSNQERPEGVAPPAADALAALRDQGFLVSQLSEGHPLVRVDRVPKGARLADLAAIAPQVAWLNLDGFQIASGDLQALAGMPHLTRLELQHSNLRDADLVDVAAAANLAVLNLSATPIGDAGLQHLSALQSLERLYLWHTHATPAGIQDLRARLPKTVIDTGSSDVQGAGRRRTERKSV